MKVEHKIDNVAILQVPRRGGVRCHQSLPVKQEPIRGDIYVSVVAVRLEHFAEGRGSLDAERKRGAVFSFYEELDLAGPGGAATGWRVAAPSGARKRGL